MEQSGMTAQELCAQRRRRLADAATLGKPDRIPMSVFAGYYLADYAGISHRDFQDDWEKGQQAMEKFALEFEPESLLGVMSPWVSLSLGSRMTAWPGHGLPDSGSFQFVEHEFMKADEYDAFLHDPSDWAIRTYLPRAFAELEGLGHLPPLGMWAFGFYNLSNLAFYSAPPIKAAMKALARAVELAVEDGERMAESNRRMEALGFPSTFFVGAPVEAPFDFMSDTLRGMRGIMLDMLRQPEKVLAAEEVVLTTMLEFVLHFSKVTGLKWANFPLHRGSDGFMSLQQFERFYWPQLKRFLETLIEHDITPYVFFEGVWDSRLEYLAELPKGKIVGHFQKSDIFKVKEIVGDTMCIGGGMPNSLLAGGTISEVQEFTHELCEKVGKNGGYIMGTSVGELEGSKAELVRAWVDATREFGVY